MRLMPWAYSAWWSNSPYRLPRSASTLVTSNAEFSFKDCVNVVDPHHRPNEIPMGESPIVFMLDPFASGKLPGVDVFGEVVNENVSRFAHDEGLMESICNGNDLDPTAEMLS